MKRVATKLAVFLFGIVLPILLIQALTTQKVFGQDLGLIQGEVIKVLVRRGVLANPGASFTGGDITAITAGSGLTGGGTSGAVSLAVGDLSATYQSTDADLTALGAISGQRGDVIYYGASGWTRLAKGSSTAILSGDGNDPTWSTPSIAAVVSQGLAAKSYQGTVTALSDASIDFNDGMVQTLSIAGDTTFTTTMTGLASGVARSCRVKVTTDGTQRNLTFPSNWKWIGTKPSSLALSTSAYLFLVSDGANETDVVARWVVLGSGS